MCGLVDDKPFQVSADDISKFLGVLNEGDVTYLKMQLRVCCFGNIFLTANWMAKCSNPK